MINSQRGVRPHGNGYATFNSPYGRRTRSTMERTTGIIGLWILFAIAILCISPAILSWSLGVLHAAVPAVPALDWLQSLALIVALVIVGGALRGGVSLSAKSS